MDTTSAGVVINQTQWQSVAGWNVVQGTFLAAVVVVGCFFNVFIVTAVLSSRKLRRRITDVLCCHLALVGIVWSTLLLPTNVLAAFTGGWPLRGTERGPCDTYGCAQSFLVHVTMWTIAMLGWNKYRTISTPLRHVSAINRQRIAIILLPIWTSGLMLACIPRISRPHVGSYGYSTEITTCIYQPSLTTDNDAPTIASVVYSFATTVFGFLLPVGVTAHSYFRIYSIARWHRKRIALMSAVVQVISLSVGVPMSGQGLPEVSRQNGNRNPPAANAAADQCWDRKTSRNVLAFVLAMIVCYAPHYSLVAVATALRRFSHPPYSFTSSLQFPVPVEALSSIILSASPVVNGFIYGVRNRSMIRSFRSLVSPPTLGERLQRHMMSNV